MKPSFSTWTAPSPKLRKGTATPSTETAYYVAAVQSGTFPLRPGVHRLLHEAREAGLRLAIATTTSPANVEALLQSTLTPGLFEVIGAGDVVPHKKPAPDIYQFVLDRLRLPAPQCLAFEDSLNGLHAAQSAGTPPSKHQPLRRQIGFEDALIVVDSLDKLNVPALRGLHT